MRKSRLTNKLIIIFFVLLLLIMSSNIETAKAAGLNAYEAEVINTAKGNFELNGIQYHVDPVFIQQLSDYLNQEDVEINAAQKDEIIGMMFSNIEQGVAEGYLIPTSVQEDVEIVEDGNDEIDSNDTPKRNVETDTEGDKPQKTSDHVIQDEEVNDYTEVLDEIRKQPTTKTEVDQNKNKVTVTKEDNSVLIVNTVIKNTGYNMKPAMIAITGIVGIFILCIIITLKYNFFKQEER